MDMKTNDTPQDAGNQNRRGFLKTGAASIAAGLSVGVIAPSASGEVTSTENSPAAARAIQDMMPTRNLGKTGFRVGIFGLGGQGALEKANNESLALQMIQRALELGVNYFDTSAIYGGPDRWSEHYLGKGLKGSRDHVFIATKTKERSRDAALKNLDVSLKLLDTDHIDAWQLHDVGIQEDIDQIFGKGGAIEALVQARDQKIVRHLGVTGRFRPEALIECINRFPFDTVLMGLNAADKYYYSFEKRPSSAGRGETDGNYRNEGDGTRPHSFQLDTAACGTTKAFMGRPRRNHYHSGYADEAGNFLLHAVAAHQHGNHRV